MDIGRLNKKVQIVRKTLEKNSVGEYDNTVEVLSNPLFCKIVPFASTVTAQQADLSAVAYKYRFTFRKDSVKDLKEDDVFLHKGERYTIDTVDIDQFAGKFKEVVVSLERGD